MEQIAEEIISTCVAAAGIHLTVGTVLLAVELPIGGSPGTPQAMPMVSSARP